MLQSIFIVRLHLYRPGWQQTVQGMHANAIPCGLNDYADVAGFMLNQNKC